MKNYYPTTRPFNSCTSLIKSFVFAIAIILNLGISIEAISQDVYESWVNPKGTQEFYLKNTIRTDQNGNVFQAGATLTSNGDYAIILTKFNRSGVELWSQTYDLAGSDEIAVDIYLASNGDIYLAGTSGDPTTSIYAALVQKYNASGTLSWSESYTASNSVYNVATSITGDGNQIYVGGLTYNWSTSSDFLALAYSTGGNPVWEYTWDHVGLNDGITKIYQEFGRLYVAGGTEVDPNNWKYCVQLLDPQTGFQLQETISGGSGIGIDKIADIDRDNLGNIYVTGGAVNVGTGFDFQTIKMDSTLNVLWVQSFNSANAFDDVANGLVIDNVGNVYVTGHSQTQSDGSNYNTVKYNAQGMQEWAISFNGLGNAADTSKAIVLDDNQNVIITGTSFNGSNEDIHTIKYNPLGEEVWNIRYNGLANGSDTPLDMVIDDFGDIIIAGQSGSDGVYKHISLKYKEVVVTSPLPSISQTNENGFTENRGQMAYINGGAADEIKFYGQDYGANLFLADDKFSFLRHQSIDSTTALLCRFDILPYQMQNVTPYSKGESKYFRNFYFPHIIHGRERVHDKETVIYPEIWANVDLTVNSNSSGSNFYYVMKKGAKQKAVQFTLSGHSNAGITGQNELVIVTADCGEHILPAPTAYQISTTGQEIALSWAPQFELNGNLVSFALGTYDANLPLVLAFERTMSGGSYSVQGLCWSTFFSGFGSVIGKTVEYDKSDNVIGGADISPGAFSFSTVGTNPYNPSRYNTAVFKLKNNFNLDWMTFYGGSNRTVISDLAENSQGKIYCVGSSSASDLDLVEDPIGATSLDYSGSGPGSGSAFDAILFQYLGESGELQWSTYLGYSESALVGNDFGTNIIIGDDDKFYVTGLASGAGFPSTATTNSFNGGGNDAFLCEFNSNNTLTWTYFLGGSNLDQPLGLQFDEAGNIWIKGTTQSNDFELVNPNAQDPLVFYDDQLSGINDDFITQIDPVAQSVIYSTYIGGTRSETGVRELRAFSNQLAIGKNKLYTIGSTKSNGNSFPFKADLGNFNFNQNNVGPETFTSPSNGYIFALDIDTYHQEWGTFMNNATAGNGSDARNIPFSVELKVFSNDTPDLLILAGSASNPSVLSVGANFFYSQEPAGGFQDGFIYAFNAGLFQNSLSRSTFFGGNQRDVILDIAFNDFDQILFTGQINSPSTYPGFPLDNPGNGALFTDNLFSDFGVDHGFFSAICDEGIITSDELIPGDIKSILTLYPNPSVDLITLFTSIQGYALIEIFDISGRLVITHNIKGTSKLDIDLTSLHSGTYILRMRSENGVESAKIVKL